VLRALLALSISSVPVNAQSSGVDVLQSPDGTLYLQQGSTVWTVLPDPVGDADLVGYSRVGQLEGTIPGDLIATGSLPVDLMQSTDGTLYVMRLGSLWTLVPALIGADVAAGLMPVGDAGSQFTDQNLQAIAHPAQAVSMPAPGSVQIVHPHGVSLTSEFSKVPFWDSSPIGSQFPSASSYGTISGTVTFDVDDSNLREASVSAVDILTTADPISGLTGAHFTCCSQYPDGYLPRGAGLRDQVANFNVLSSEPESVENAKGTTLNISFKLQFPVAGLGAKPKILGLAAAREFAYANAQGRQTLDFSRQPVAGVYNGPMPVNPGPQPRMPNDLLPPPQQP
jgi:hypothetical protein